jgi:hypothetical protein
MIRPFAAKVRHRPVVLKMDWLDQITPQRGEVKLKRFASSDVSLFVAPVHSKKDAMDVAQLVCFGLVKLQLVARMTEILKPGQSSTFIKGHCVLNCTFGFD